MVGNAKTLTNHNASVLVTIVVSGKSEATVYKYPTPGIQKTDMKVTKPVFVNNAGLRETSVCPWPRTPWRRFTPHAKPLDPWI